MFKRNLSRLLVVCVALVAALSVSPGASADVGFIYKCDNVGGGIYQIAFAKIYTCSNGPADNSIIHKINISTGKQTAWIGGECAFYAYHNLGWRDMTKTWNHCLTHKDWPTCGGSICQS